MRVETGILSYVGNYYTIVNLVVSCVRDFLSYLAHLFFQIGNRYVVDATAEEEVCSDSQLLVSINEAGRVCSLQKHGRGGFHPDLLFEMMQV